MPIQLYFYRFFCSAFITDNIIFGSKFKRSGGIQKKYFQFHIFIIYIIIYKTLQLYLHYLLYLYFLIYCISITNGMNLFVPHLERSIMILERKNIVTCIILSIVTCGIYGIYWLYCIISDINTISGDPDSMSPIVVILLSYVTCGIYLFYWIYKAGALLDQKAVESGRASESRAILYLILTLCLCGIVAYALIQDSINKIADDQNNFVNNKPVF